MNYQYRKSFLKFHGTKKKNKDKYNSCLMMQNFFHFTEFCTATISFNILNPSDVPAKSYPHRGTRAGLMEPLSRVFYMLRYFEKALLSVENL